MAITSDHVTVLRAALFEAGDEATRRLEWLSSEDAIPFGCLLAATVAEAVERTLGRAPRGRPDIIRLVADLRKRHGRTYIEPGDAEQMLRLVFGDGAVLDDAEVQKAPDSQLVVARALAADLRLDMQEIEQYMETVRSRAERIALLLR